MLTEQLGRAKRQATAIADALAATADGRQLADALRQVATDIGAAQQQVAHLHLAASGLAAGTAPPPPSPAVRPAAEIVSGLVLTTERHLVGLLLGHPHLVGEAIRALSPEAFRSDPMRRIIGELFTRYQFGQPVHVDAVCASLQAHPELGAQARRLHAFGSQVREPAAWLARLARHHRRQSDPEHQSRHVVLLDRARFAATDEAFVDALRDLQAAAGDA